MGVLDRTATLNISGEHGNSTICKRRIKKLYVIFGSFAIVLVFLIALVLFLIGAFEDSEKIPDVLSPPNPTKPLPASISKLHTFKKAAVCADGPPCAEIGRKILLQNGSAVDAAIAALFCNGLANMQSMGIGGGFLMTIYNRSEGRAYTLNAREVAPLAATAGMFKGNANLAKKGGLAIGVPGELKGYWEAHQMFGVLPWRELIIPSIKLCEEGYVLRQPQHKSVSDMKNMNAVYRGWFLDDKQQVKKIGSLIRPRQYCKTLKIIAEEGADSFYNGSLSKLILKDLSAAGSIITKEDLAQYAADWMEPISARLGNGHKIYTIPPPGSGVLLAYILQILDGYNFTRESIDGVENTVLTYHRIAESFKHAYARRTELADAKFVDLSQMIKELTSHEYAEKTRSLIHDDTTNQNPQKYGAVFYDTMNDNGTAHISVLAENGDAVSVTSTLNLYFGSDVVSESTGITFNSVMDDFSSEGFVNYFGLPGSPNNRIQPGKRPLSSMTPTIITDADDDVALVIGASGGTMITTGVAQVIMRLLWFDQNIKEAVDAPRLHHQLYPMTLGYEYGTLQQFVDGLAAKGHNVTRSTSISVICALMRKGDTIFGNADHRKGGSVFGID